MEFPFDLAGHIQGVPQGHTGPRVGCIDERALRGSSGSRLATVLEELGQKSAKAQALRKPVTYGSSLGEHRVYVLVDGRVALGFLKVGPKRLFLASPQVSAFADVQGAFREIEPLCALDFYVHEGHQRCGYGRQLFDAMLEGEQTTPAQLGYDRPSPKLLAFLKRHFGLHKFRPQSNNFVVFEDYFQEAAGQGTSRPRTGDPAFNPEAATPTAAGGLRAGYGMGSACSGERRASRLTLGGPGPVRDLFGDVPIQPRVGAVGSR